MVSSTAISSESGVGCSATLGYDSTTVTGLDGTTRSYGYSAEYLGHASVLMADLGTSWEAVAPASFEKETGRLDHDPSEGYIDY